MIKPPKQVTLDKYGLSEDEWREIFVRQNGCCAICKNPFEEGKRINTDHYHTVGYKKLPPEERKKLVRGLLCYFDNKFIMVHGITIVRLQNALNYLRQFDERRKNGGIISH